MERYEKICQIGKGGFSKVYKCKVKETGDVVAIKMLIDEDEDEPRLRQLAMREIRLLHNLHHPNIIRLFEVFRRKRRLHFVFEFCQQTVLNVIELNPKGVPFSIVQSIIWQTLQALSYLHANSCLHRDVKPENLLLTKDGVVKLCDFGWARKSSPGEGYTDYVATRWYRAPELIVGDTNYDSKVDVWAVGGVLAELIRCEPLWPGRSDLDQLFLITRTIGELIPRHMTILKTNAFFAGVTIPTHETSQPLEDKFSPSFQNSELMNFLKCCFEKDPSNRHSCDQLLAHNFFRNFHFSYPAKTNEKGNLLPQLPESTRSISDARGTPRTSGPHLPNIT